MDVCTVIGIDAPLGVGREQVTMHGKTVFILPAEWNHIMATNPGSTRVFACAKLRNIKLDGFPKYIGKYEKF